ncbi:signal peptidase [Curtobacterium flaccumfaciens]|uniref:Signal peptidase I n=1 Tax=Curtobacterium flaccumfaciens TaxID=2035 RepID=A0A4R6DC20_9MICO|nr:signal peptidase I [Curtobacterium flaccumfaciens]TDN41870.1 signal peptidase [Curtobacterium flaccumfaciens]
MHALALGLTTGLLVIVAGLAVVLIVIPKTTGSTPLTVLTQSMDPTLPPGTLLVVRPTPVADIRIGDVVTYQIVSGQPAVISHRVVSVASTSDGSRTFVLKGDNNALADPEPVTAAQVRGVVWYSLPDVGLVNQLVNGSRTWLVPAIAGVLLAYGAVMVTMGVVSAARRRGARGTGRADAGAGAGAGAHADAGAGAGAGAGADAGAGAGVGRRGRGRSRLGGGGHRARRGHRGHRAHRAHRATIG